MKLKWKRTPNPYKTRIEEIRESVKKLITNPALKDNNRGGLITNIIPEAVQTLQLESLVLLMEESRTLSNLTKSLRWLTVILTVLTAVLILTTLGIKLPR